MEPLRILDPGWKVQFKTKTLNLDRRPEWVEISLTGWALYDKNSKWAANLMLAYLELYSS